MHDEIQMEATVMVGADACGSSEEAFGSDSTQDSWSRKTVYGASAGFTALQLRQLVWLNKAVPVVPHEFRGGGNVFDRL